MNWLMYIGGWFIGGLLLGHFNKNSRVNAGLLAVIWLMTWIWICWRFIKQGG